MRLGLTAILVAVAALVAAGLLGVASAEAPTTTPIRTVGVEGIASVPIAREADGATANAAYRQAMAAAISDGLEKAQFLAGHVGGTLGAVQNVVEEGGGVSCESSDNEHEYTPYLGVQPDFGTGQSPGQRSAAEAAPSLKSAPSTAHRSKPKKKKAKKASVVSCTVTAGVAINYQLD